MQSLLFTNPAGDTLAVAYSAPFFLQGLTGLSESPLDILSARGYGQDGQSAAGQSLQARPVSFSIMVGGHNMLEAYQNRRRLIAFLNPKYEPYQVIYQNDWLRVAFSCRVTVAPSFESAQAKQTVWKSCTVSLLADDPYLYDTDETSVMLSIAEPKLQLPLSLLTGGVTLSTMSNKRATIENSGDVSTPIRVRFAGGSTNPVITNSTTGEFIRVVKAIAATDILEITTGYGDKRVEVISSDGSRSNAFNYIDLNSTFFELQVGTNELVYDASSGADSAAVSIFYRQRYVGV